MSARIGAVLAIGVVVIGAGLVLALGNSKARQAGSNYVPEVGEARTVKGEDSFCQADQVIPADTGALRVLVGTYGRPMPELRVTLSAAGDRISSGRLPAGGGEGRVNVPIEPVTELRDRVTVCVSVVGAEPRTRTVFYGANGVMRYEWLRPGNDSWFEMVPTVAHRFGLGRALLEGGWVLALAGLLLAAAWALALRLTLRELSE